MKGELNSFGSDYVVFLSGIGGQQHFDNIMHLSLGAVHRVTLLTYVTDNVHCHTDDQNRSKLSKVEFP